MGCVSKHNSLAILCQELSYNVLCLLVMMEGQSLYSELYIYVCYIHRTAVNTTFKPVWYGEVDCSGSESDIESCTIANPVGYAASCSGSNLRNGAEVYCCE